MSLRFDDESIIVFTPTPQSEYRPRIGENQCLNLESYLFGGGRQQFIHYLGHRVLEVATPL